MVRIVILGERGLNTLGVRAMFTDCKGIGDHVGAVCKWLVIGVVMSIVIVVGVMVEALTPWD